MNIVKLYDSSYYTANEENDLNQTQLNNDQKESNIQYINSVTYCRYEDYDGSAGILIKDKIDSDKFLKIILKYHNKNKNKLTHTFVINDGNDKYLLSDCVINPYPTVKDKLYNVTKSIEFYNKYIHQYQKPIINLLTPNGHFSPVINETIENIALCEYLKQQYPNYVFDYKQFDYCMSQKTRDIKTKNNDTWKRNANIIIVNNLCEGNSLLKALLLNKEGYGFLLGADIPVILNSRSNLDMNEQALNIIRGN